MGVPPVSCGTTGFAPDDEAAFDEPDDVPVGEGGVMTMDFDGSLPGFTVAERTLPAAVFMTFAACVTADAAVFDTPEVFAESLEVVLEIRDDRPETASFATTEAVEVSPLAAV